MSASSHGVVIAPAPSVQSGHGDASRPHGGGRAALNEVLGMDIYLSEAEPFWTAGLLPAQFQSECPVLGTIKALMNGLEGRVASGLLTQVVVRLSWPIEECLVRSVCLR